MSGRRSVVNHYNSGDFHSEMDPQLLKPHKGQSVYLPESNVGVSGTAVRSADPVKSIFDRVLHSILGTSGLDFIKHASDLGTSYLRLSAEDLDADIQVGRSF